MGESPSIQSRGTVRLAGEGGRRRVPVVLAAPSSPPRGASPSSVPGPASDPRWLPGLRSLEMPAQPSRHGVHILRKGALCSGASQGLLRDASRRDSIVLLPPPKAAATGLSRSERRLRPYPCGLILLAGAEPSLSLSVSR